MPKYIVVNVSAIPQQLVGFAKSAKEACDLQRKYAATEECLTDDTIEIYEVELHSSAVKMGNFLKLN